MGKIPLPDIDIAGVLPALILCVAGIVVMLTGLFVRVRSIATAAVISFVGVVLAFAANEPLRSVNRLSYSGLVAVDAFTWFLNLLLLAAAGITILVSVRYMVDDGPELFEYFVLLLFATAGMMFMVSANHLLLIFVGLETLSISIYVLAGIMPESIRSKEAGLKYLVLGAFSSGFFLYGAALLYGATGSLSLPTIAKFLQSDPSNLLALAGMGLLLVGFSFKVAAVPFHMWTPDVYEGAATPLTGYMSVAVKAGAFAAFMRVFFEGLLPLQVNWTQMLWLIAAVTMIVGNVVALVQENIKRMLAYSSIAHAGYIIIGLVAGSEAGTGGILYYLLAYTFTNLGAFAVVTLVGRKGEANTMIDDYRGLAKSHPVLALAMSVFLFSLAGMPPTAGFVGKFTIFKAAVTCGYIWLVVIGVLTSAISVYYYFRVIMKMYMETRETEIRSLQFEPSLILALTVTAIVVLYIGIFPSPYLSLATASVKPLF